MRLSLAIGALPWYPLWASLRLARWTGFNGVELLCTPWILARGPDRMQRIAKNAGVPVLSVHTQLRFRNISPEQLAEDAARALEFAAGIPTCEVVTVHHPVTDGLTSSDVGRWLNRLERHRSQIGDGRVHIAVENRPQNNDGLPDQALDDPVMMRSVAAEWDFGITLDLAHAASMELPFGMLLRDWLPRLRNVHLSDANDRQLRGGLKNGFLRDHQLPGRGSLPLSETVHYLTNAGYTGPVTLELNPLTVGAWCPPLALRRLRRSVEMLRSGVSIEPLGVRDSESSTSSTRRN